MPCLVTASSLASPSGLGASKAYGEAPGDTIRTGAYVVRAMHDRYAGRWYRNLALVQTVRYHSAPAGAARSVIDSVRVWYESIRLPGTVRSDIAPLDGGDSQLYANGSWHLFSGDSLVSVRSGPHPVLLLGFDVYVQPVEQTLGALERFGIDVTPWREDEWQDRPMFVVGSTVPGDGARQFWVDQEQLLVRRLLWTTASGAQREVRFDEYEPLGGGWIATRLAFLRNGRVEIDERYDYWKIGLTFDPAIFATQGRTRPGWIVN